MRSYFLLFIANCFFVAIPSSLAQPIHTEIALVDAELFGVDRSHSHLGFSIRFMGMSSVKGTFNDYDVAILYNEADMTKTSVTVILDVASIDTANDWRDKDLQSERFFDAAQYPKIVFQSDRIEEATTGFLAHGRLTMRGVTREIAVPLKRTLLRTADAGWGNIRIGFEGRFTLNRTEYGIHGSDFWGVGMLSEEVDIEFGLLGTIMNQEKITFRSREKPSIGEVLQQTIAEKDVAAAVAQYHDLKTQHETDYNFAESELNRLGYKLLEQGRAAEAVQVFQLNAEAYPESANVYDSLGQGYAALGNRQQALAHYKRALTLDPYIPSAMEMTRRLGG
ncbi:MAG TPA: YceI family protein [Rhodothermales bacterium]|nr:YceI family protein [Rhodothermales bacterium]